MKVIVFIVLLLNFIAGVYALEPIPGDSLIGGIICPNESLFFFSSCEPQIVTFVIIDTICFHIDTTRLYFTITNITNEETLRVIPPSPAITITGLSDSIIVSISPLIDYVDGDSITVSLDSAFTICDSIFCAAIGGTSCDNGASIIQTSDTGYAAVGRTNHSGTTLADIFLVKFNRWGFIQWTTTVGGSDWDEGVSIVQTSDDGYAVTGNTKSFGAGNYDLLLVKFNSSGSVEWARAIGGANNDSGNSIVQTYDGGYIVVGRTSSYGAGNFDVFVIKLNSSGSIEWTRAIGGTDDDEAFSVIQTVDSTYIIAGYTRNYGSWPMDLLLVKLTSSGLIEWFKTIGGVDTDEGCSVIQTSDRGYIVAGDTWSYGAGSWDMFFVKLDSTGSIQWSKAIGGTNDEDCKSVVQTSDNGYAAVGKTLSYGVGIGSANAFVVKISTEGYFEWACALGDEGWDFGSSIVQTFDDGYTICGETGYGPGSNLFIAKLAPDGSACCGIYVTPIVTDASPSSANPFPISESPLPSVWNGMPTVTDITPIVTRVCP